jgi:fatty acid desaturase
MAFIAAASWTLLPYHRMLKGWLYPLLVAGQFANLRGLAEHGLTTGGNELTDTRTVTTHPTLAFMMCNINFHLEHHLYPGIPWYNLPKLHALLRDEYVEAGSSVYRSYAAFLWDVAKALTHGVVLGSRLIPSHIREAVCL